MGDISRRRDARGLHGGPGTRTGSGLYFKWTAESGPNLLLRVPGLFNLCVTPESIGEHRTHQRSRDHSLCVTPVRLIAVDAQCCLLI